MSKQCPPNSPKAQDPNYICNPQSGRWIKKDGACARKLKIGTFSSPCPSNSPKAKDPNYMCNPKTGRWIKKKKHSAKAPPPSFGVSFSWNKQLLNQDFVVQFGNRIPPPSIVA